MGKGNGEREVICPRVAVRNLVTHCIFNFLRIVNPVLESQSSMLGPLENLDQSARETIRGQLEAVLGSPLFVRAERQSRFLRHVVECALAGDTGGLKESRIGVSVYGRKEDYDTRADPIVRVEAARLRSKLREYYEANGRNEPIRFEIPKGSYAPSFLVESGPAEEKQVGVSAPVARRWTAWQWAVPLVVVAVGAALLASRYWSGTTHSSSQTLTSVAVLPFQDLSEKRDQQYFCDGLTDQITDELARVSGLQVAGRTSADQFRGRKESLRDVGRKLNVEAVLEGSVRAEGNRVRVTANLVDTTTGFQVWSGTYDRDRRDAFALQDDVSQALGRALQVKLAPRRDDPSALRSVARLEAQKLFMAGRELHRKMDQASLAEARKLHEAAVSSDPNYPLGHSGLAHVYVSLMSEGLATDEELRDRSYSEARRAIELDPGLADAYAALVRLARDIDLDPKAAEAVCREAAPLTPNVPGLLVNCATVYSIRGQHEQALANLRAAIRIDPLWPGAREALSAALCRASRLGEAENVARSMVADFPAFVPGYRSLAWIHLVQNRPQEALADLDTGVRRETNPSGLAVALRGLALARAGRRGEANSVLGALLRQENRNTFSHTWPALVFLGLGDRKQAIDRLEHTVRSREPGALETMYDPLLKPLEDDPRFVALRRAISR